MTSRKSSAVRDRRQLGGSSRNAAHSNRADEAEYIVRLIGKVITVSLEKMKIVKALPALVTEIAPKQA